MWLTTHKLLHKQEEENCIKITPERRYYHVDDVFIKRSLRKDEWIITEKGTIHVPRLGPERLINEAAAMRYVAANTNVPVSRLHCCFEDDGAIYLIMEYVEGVTMASLNSEQKDVVKAEIRRHLKTLHGLHSRRVGAPDPRAGLVIPPYRVQKEILRDDCTFPDAETDEYVFCHNDLSQQNVIVDPQTLKIKALIKWEYAGFWPVSFERPFFERPGPSVALPGERADWNDVAGFYRKRPNSVQCEQQ